MDSKNTVERKDSPCEAGRGVPSRSPIERDSIVESVVRKFQDRSLVGIKKYGVTLDRTDLGLADWIQHAQEELMDAILYLEKLKQQNQEPLHK
jgi:hypothetical protein